MTEKLSPALLIEKRFGGVVEVAKIVGRNHSMVSKWKNPHKKDSDGGRDGRVPDHAHRALLEAAAARGIPLTAEELIYGGDA
jgi:hypothetical protein